MREVISAFGRAGAWFTSNDYGLAPDMITLANGITSGYMLMAALMLDNDVANTINDAGPGNAYDGHAAGAAVGSAHIDTIENENLLENSQVRSTQILNELNPLTTHPLVGDIRGRGLMIGIELVSHCDTHQPLADAARWLNGDLPRLVRRNHGVLLGVRSSSLL